MKYMMMVKMDPKSEAAKPRRIQIKGGGEKPAVAGGTPTA